MINFYNRYKVVVWSVYLLVVWGLVAYLFLTNDGSGYLRLVAVMTIGTTYGLKELFQAIKEKQSKTEVEKNALRTRSEH